MRRKKPEKSTDTHVDYIIEFTECKFDVVFNEQTIYDEDEQSDIIEMIDTIGNSITIDKSFVEYQGTKFQKNFMREEGWNQLCALLTKTKYGLNATAYEKNELLICYTLIVQCYVYQLLDDIGIDIDELTIVLRDGAKFYTHVEVDKIKAWEKYLGKWQTWGKETIDKLLL